MHVEISAYLPIMEGRSHLCDTAKSSLGISLLRPGCLRPYPDRRDMCVSMLIDAWQSLGQNERETDENGQELSENGTPGAASRREFPVMEGQCHVTRPWTRLVYRR
jgi:hypothetical protein